MKVFMGSSFIVFEHFLYIMISKLGNVTICNQIKSLYTFLSNTPKEYKISQVWVQSIVGLYFIAKLKPLSIILQ